MAHKILEMFGFDTDPIIGLDISSTAIKLMQLSKKGDQVRIEAFAIEPLEPGVVIEKNIINRERVVEAIQAVVKKAKVTSKKVCVCIPSSSSISKILKMSADLNDKEIGNEIQLEAERYIPYSLDEINLDYTVVGPVESKSQVKDEEAHASMVYVLLAVSKIEVIDNMKDLLAEADLVPAIIDIDSMAMMRAFEGIAKKLPGQTKRKIIALFDIGATITTMNVINQNQIIYTREQAFGGQHLVDEIENRYGLTYDEALLALKFQDLPDDYTMEILEPFKQSVAQQVSRFCQFFFSSGDYTNIDYIYITGGVSSLPGLDTLIQSKLQVKTFMANPVGDFLVPANINMDAFKRDVNRLMVCCGLALRNIYPNDKH